MLSSYWTLPHSIRISSQSVIAVKVTFHMMWQYILQLLKDPTS